MEYQGIQRKSQGVRWFFRISRVFLLTRFDEWVIRIGTNEFVAEFTTISTPLCPRRRCRISMMPPLSNCWAKTDPVTGRPALTVRDHCLIVGAVAEAILKRLSPAVARLAPRRTAFVAAVHDIGKISPGFQSKCPHATLFDARANRYEGDHAKLGQAWLGSLAELRGSDGRALAWTLSIGAHHGGYHPDLSHLLRDLRAEAQTFPWAAALRRELLDQLADHFGPICDEEFSRDSARVHWLTGLVTFADWIGSNSEWFELSSSSPLSDCWTPEGARTRADDAVGSLGWHRRDVLPGLGFGRLFDALPDGNLLSPRPLQETLITASASPGLYIVEAPMGMGKTEAALAASYRRWTEGDERGLYFALPTQLTSNRIHERISGFLDRIVADADSVQALVHGNAWLFPQRIRALQPTHENSSGDATDAHRWFASGRRALLAPFGTGTIDQALMAVMAAKHAALRLFALSGKTVVIDEVHSYDPYTSALVDRLVTNLIEVGCSVFILSATLTARRRAELVAAAGAQLPGSMPDDYPLITRVKSGASNAEPIRVAGENPTETSVRIVRRLPDDPSEFQAIADAAEAGACVLVIRNTVRSAQETYLALKSCLREGTGVETGLLHSRYTFLDREASERLWMDRLGRDSRLRPQHGAILVATQVVEQSVDIDADLLVTDLAPVDLLIQRLGRLHRHQRERRPVGFETPTCWILSSEIDWNAGEKEIKAALGPSAWVYPPFALYQADRIFGTWETLVLPTGIRTILEESDQIPEGLPNGASAFRTTLDKEVQEMSLSAARQGWLDAVLLPDVEGTKTRWGAERSGFLVLLGDLPSTVDGRTRISPREGKDAEVRTGEFSFPLAKVLHENAIRVPWYWIGPGVGEQPKWVSEHIEDAMIGVGLPDELTLTLPYSDAHPYAFSYSSEIGLRMEKVMPDSRWTDSEEDSWY